MIKRLLEDRLDTLVNALYHWERRKDELTKELEAVERSEERCKAEMAELSVAISKTFIEGPEPL